MTVRPLCVAAFAFAVWCTHVVSATSVVPPKFHELVNESDYIVRAVVVSVTPELRARTGARSAVFTRVQLEVTEVIAGKPPNPLILEVMGGKVGNVEMVVSDAPPFVVGESSILFVQGNGRQIYPLVRMMHGLYRVEKDTAHKREHVVRSNGEPLRDVEEVAHDLHRRNAQGVDQSQLTEPGLSPAEFVRKIRAAATKRELREP